MPRYVITFSKQGLIKYTSHLDMVRLFKRAFNRSGIYLEYSNGFNPHPKMVFAQPLALGYTSEGELLEFDTRDEYDADDIRNMVNKNMPSGIRVLRCVPIEKEKKSLAAKCCAAEYRITVPLPEGHETPENALRERFLAQSEITALKKEKKTGEMKPVDIKSGIRSLEIKIVDNKILLTAILDAGSSSNISPELLLNSFTNFIGLTIERETVEISRLQIFM